MGSEGKKAAELLSASIKMERSADVPLETKSYYAKWALQEAKGRDEAQEKAKMLGKSAEDFKELATLHPWRAGGKERQQGKKKQPVVVAAAAAAAAAGKQRWPQLRSSPKRWPLRLSRMQLELSRAPLTAGKDPTGGQVLGRATTAGRKSPRRVKNTRGGNNLLLLLPRCGFFLTAANLFDDDLFRLVRILEVLLLHLGPLLGEVPLVNRVTESALTPGLRRPTFFTQSLLPHRQGGLFVHVVLAAQQICE